MAGTEGAARPLQKGRLTSFEDAGGDLDFQLPPLRRVGEPAVAERAVTEVSPAELTEVPSVPGPQPDADSAVPQNRVRPSNTHIPVALKAEVDALGAKKGLSHGELIISAIEETIDELKDLIQPAAVTGGTVFSSRRGRGARATDGPLTPLNYRLRQEDFTVLDGLVEQFGASSRGHLITAALTAYVGRQH